MEEQQTQLLKVNEENFDSLKSMMISEDEADRTVALHCLEAADWEKSWVYILCLAKFAKPDGTDKWTRDIWNENAPKVLEHMDELNLKIETAMNFRTIYQILVEKKCDRDEMAFALNLFKEAFIDIVKDWGFDFLDEIDIEFKPKDHVS